MFVVKLGSVSGIKNIKNQEDFIIYPNPSNGIFSIETKENDQMFVITNLLGENIYQSEIKNPKTEIDLSDQPNGIYFVKLETEKGTTIKKIVINM